MTTIIFQIEKEVFHYALFLFGWMRVGNKKKK